MADKYEYYITGDDDGWSQRAERWEAQTFTPSTAHKITSVKLKLYREGSPGTLTVSIRATDGSGHPTGGDLCSGTTNGNTLPTALPYEWREITLGAGYNLSAGIKYAIVLRAPDGDLSNYSVWRGDKTNPTYWNGCREHSIDSGSSWTTYDDIDFMFEEWGEPAVTAPTVTTQAASSVDCEAATLNGNITDTGGENCDYRGFVWDTASHGDPGNTAPASSAYASYWTESGSYGTGAFSHGISGLPSGQTYYFRACAHNSAGWSYGGEVNFTTVGESSYNTMVGDPTSWTWQKVDYESAEKCLVGSPTSWGWQAPTCKGADKTPQGSPTSFSWGSE